MARTTTAAISAPTGLHFGSTFMPAWTPPAVKAGDLLWARATCRAGGLVVYIQDISLDRKIPGNVGPFTLGPTPMWSAGPASGTITMYTTDASAAHMSRPLASGSFEVAA